MERLNCEHTLIIEHDCPACQETARWQTKYISAPVIFFVSFMFIGASKHALGIEKWLDIFLYVVWSTLMLMSLGLFFGTKVKQAVNNVKEKN